MVLVIEQAPIIVFLKKEKEKKKIIVNRKIQVISRANEVFHMLKISHYFFLNQNNGGDQESIASTARLPIRPTDYPPPSHVSRAEPDVMCV